MNLEPCTINKVDMESGKEPKKHTANFGTFIWIYDKKRTLFSNIEKNKSYSSIREEGIITATGLLEKSL